MIERREEGLGRMLSFAKELAPDRLAALHGKVHLELARGAILNTPVDQGTYNADGDRVASSENAGRTRGAWQSSINAPEEGNPVREGQAALAEAARVAVAMPPAVVSWVVNNSPNIEVLENGGYPNPPKDPGYTAAGETKSVGGYSRQAPKGMVKLTVNRVGLAFR